MKRKYVAEIFPLNFFSAKGFNSQEIDFQYKNNSKKKKNAFFSEGYSIGIL